MPKEGISLYVTIQDSASSVLTSLGDKTKALDKETQSLAQAQEGLKRANEPLLRQQAELRAALDKLKSETKDAKKAWEQYGDELHEGIYTNLLEEQAELQEQLRNVNDQVKANQKTFREYQEDIRKGGISESGGTLGGELSGSILTAIVGGQIGQMLSSSLGGAAQTLLTSAIGTPTANLASDAISSAIQGAALGTAIAPGIGTAIGAGAGALSGIISGGTQIYQQRDEAFKDYYNDLYEAALTARESSTTSGSSIASQRETDRISFATLFGDDAIAADYLRDLVQMSNTTPFLYDDLTAMSKTLATYGYGADSILPVLQTVGDAGAALGMAVSDMNTVATALGRMQSSDKASLEYLNMLNERGIGAVGILADAKGVSQKDMYSMISKGEVSGRAAVSLILDALEEQFSGSMLTQSQTYSGLTSTLEGLMQELDNASGEEYNDLRTNGLREEIKAYGGALGDALKEINSLSGQNQAYLENLQEQFKREALEAVLLGSQTSLYDDDTKEKLDALRGEFVEAKRTYEEGGEKSQEAALKMQNLKDQAEIVAQNAYDSSEAVKTLHGSQIDLIDATRDLSAKFDAWQWKYEVGVEQTKGRAAAVDYDGGALGGLMSLNDRLMGSSGSWRERGRGSRNAFGLERVPYDGYAAILHQDERVLTAQEARAQDEGSRGFGDVHISFAGANFSGMPEEMTEQMVEMFVSKLEQAAAAYGR